MKQKYYLALTTEEWRLMIEVLNNLRNRLIWENRYTDAVDEVLVKVANANELSAPGGSYKLANKEYQTMLLFMRNPKVVIPSSRVLENIWDPDSKAEDNTVWTYISYLRRKLEAIKADIEIHTIRGAGYTLEVRK